MQQSAVMDQPSQISSGLNLNSYALRTSTAKPHCTGQQKRTTLKLLAYYLTQEPTSKQLRAGAQLHSNGQRRWEVRALPICCSARGPGRFTLIVAAALGKFEDVKVLLDSESDVASTALYAAARNGHTAVVEYLLDHGATIDTRGFFGGTGLHWAAINGHRDTVELLIARGASRNIRDEHFDSTPEEWAIEGGHTELAALLHTN